MKIVENKKAPGWQWLKRLPLRSRWQLSLWFGMILLAVGLLVYGQAVAFRAQQAPPLRWALTGLYAFTLLLVGLLLLLQATRLRARLDFRRELKRFRKKTTSPHGCGCSNAPCNASKTKSRRKAAKAPINRQRQAQWACLCLFRLPERPYFFSAKEALMASTSTFLMTGLSVSCLILATRLLATARLRRVLRLSCVIPMMLIINSLVL